MAIVKLLLGIGVIVAMIIVGVQVLPPYMNNYQFQDALNNQALAATYSNKSEDEIRDMAYKAAKEMDIPVKPEQIKVTRAGGMGTGTLAIEANYTVHVDLPGYPLDLNFHAASKNKGIY
ncbi:MAG: DUF4845 domain-containing protein [Acidobacteria bacterium]|nr:DUF4845 domain-containing protein [Acidobacteriota bacterium]